MRCRILAFAAASVATLCALTALTLPATKDIVLYNHSASIPRGFYLRSNAPIAIDAFVTVRAGDVAPAAARQRRFDGADDRFIKRVAALEGDHICLTGDVLIINGGPPIRRRSHDSQNTPLPRWTGCRALAQGEVLLLGDSPDSFDGRYWGPTQRHSIEGVWRQL